MALPVLLPASAKTVGLVVGVSPPLPAGAAAGHLVFLVASTIAGGTITITTNGGGAWTALGTGSQDVAAGEKLYVWYRYHQAGDTAPTVTPGSDHICATCFGYSGVDPTTPVEAIVWSSEATSDTSFSFAPGSSSSVADCTCCVIYTSGVDSNTAQGGTTINAALTSVAIVANYETTSGGGGGFVISDGDKATAGAIGTWSDTMAGATPKAYVSFVVRSPSAVAYTESATVSTVTTPISTVETRTQSDAATVPTATAVQSVQLTASVESSTVSTVTTPSAVDVSAFVDSQTTSTLTSVTTVDAEGYTDSSTVPTLTSVGSVEVPFVTKYTTIYRTQLSPGDAPNDSTPQTIYIECKKANVGDSGVLRVWLYQGVTLIEGPYDITLTNAMTVYSHDLVNYASITDWSDIEIAIQGISTQGSDLTPQVARIEFDIPQAGARTYTESATITTKTTPSATDVAAFVDAQTVTSPTSVASSETRVQSDSATVSTTTVPLFTEVAAYVDSATIPTLTSVTSVDTVDRVDAATISTITSVSTTDLAAFVDSATILTFTTPSATDVAAFIDAATVRPVTSVTAIEGAQNVYTDSSTITNILSLVGTDTLAAVESNTVSSITTPSAVERANFVDANTPTTITYVISSDIASYQDSARVDTFTTLSSIDIYGQTLIDSATIPTKTTVTYTENAQYVDSAQVSFKTTTTWTEQTTYVDTSTVNSFTTVYSIDDNTKTYFDAATVLTITTVTSVEFFKITIGNITGEFFFRWKARFDTKWGSELITERNTQTDVRWGSQLIGQKWRSEV